MSGPERGCTIDNRFIITNRGKPPRGRGPTTRRKKNPLLYKERREKRKGRRRCELRLLAAAAAEGRRRASLTTENSLKPQLRSHLHRGLLPIEPQTLWRPP